jgi:hypothetical protein
MDKYYEDKEKKLRSVMEKLKTKHENELNAFNLKTKNVFSKFKKDRALEFDS